MCFVYFILVMTCLYVSPDGRLGSQVGIGAVACKSGEMIEYFVYSNENGL